ncbi:MAG: AAA family ATPase, partial [Chromatiaceae bacterium]
MNPTPFPFEDFRRAKQRLQRALLEHHEPFVLLTGETGTGKTALLRELRAEIDRTRYRVLYFAQARKLGAVGLIKVLGEGLR